VAESRRNIQVVMMVVKGCSMHLERPVTSIKINVIDQISVPIKPRLVIAIAMRVVTLNASLLEHATTVATSVTRICNTGS
jgi:hypothetical protein